MEIRYSIEVFPISQIGLLSTTLFALFSRGNQNKPELGLLRQKKCRLIINFLKTKSVNDHNVFIGQQLPRSTATQCLVNFTQIICYNRGQKRVFSSLIICRKCPVGGCWWAAPASLTLLTSRRRAAREFAFKRPSEVWLPGKFLLNYQVRAALALLVVTEKENNKEKEELSVASKMLHRWHACNIFLERQGWSHPLQ